MQPQQLHAACSRSLIMHDPLSFTATSNFNLILLMMAGMEAAVANLLEPGEKIVVGNNGIWGTRVADMAERFRGMLGNVAMLSCDPDQHCLFSLCQMSTMLLYWQTLTSESSVDGAHLQKAGLRIFQLRCQSYAYHSGHGWWHV